MSENKQQDYYYQVDLELWSKATKSIFTFVNISHIPYIKLVEIFKDKIGDERYLFDNVAGYQIDLELYNKYKDCFTDNILCDFDFNLYDYWVGLSGDKIGKIKRSHHTSWPPNE
jgi:hypothetical protein